MHEAPKKNLGIFFYWFDERWSTIMIMLESSEGSEEGGAGGETRFASPPGCATENSFYLFKTENANNKNTWDCKWKMKGGIGWNLRILGFDRDL